jgi:hypothetical protein
MTVARHPDLRVQRLRIGNEEAPLLVIDDVVAAPDELVELAASKLFSDAPSYYPGKRVKAPLSYQRFIAEELRPLIVGHFGLPNRQLRFSECNFSLVTTPSDRLSYLQRLPHVDSLQNDELAMIHYLFRANLGGTAFYRHRMTGYEFVDKSRQLPYLAQLEREKSGPDAPPAGYINGDTALYERIASQDAVFNRLLMYRRTSLHSASLDASFVPDPNPRSGRLSINGFLG